MAGGKKKKKKTYFKVFTKYLLKVLLVVAAICIIGGSVFMLWFYNKYVREYDKWAKELVENGSRDDFRLAQPSIIYDSEGDSIVKLKSGGDSMYLKYADIPQYAIDAFVAVEDRSFWKNKGYDLTGIARVVYYYVKTRGVEAHGASTITQQLARNVYLTHEVTITRKLKEILISRYLTKKYSKEDIMEFYINNIYFANQYYGLEAASQGYFGIHAKALSLSQIAYLCSIPNRPAYYDPIKNPDNALKRRDKILGDMLELNMISREEYDAAVAEKIELNLRKSSLISDYEATFAIDCAVRCLMENDGFVFRSTFTDKDDYRNYNLLFEDQYDSEKARLYSGGYRIFTSLDSALQHKVQAALDEELAFDSEKDEESGVFALQGAAAVIDNRTGKVSAIVGGRSISSNSVSYSLNRAFQSYRQPGSTIKPLIVYGPALENGYYPGSVLMDIDLSLAKNPDISTYSLTGTPMTLRSAVEQSKNGCAWQLYSLITPQVGIKHITDMMYEKVVPDDYFMAASLGGFTYGVTMLEQASGYAALANHGIYRGRTCIISMKDSEGNEIFKEPAAVRAYSPAAADTMVDIMKGVITRGTAAKMGWSKESRTEAAGKTGTTNGSKDGWFCGMTPYYSMAVWVGYDTPRELDSLYGASYPAAIWKKSMLAAIEGLEEKSFSLDDKMEEYCLTGEKYLPGREDTEVLYGDYTVADYRYDHKTGDAVVMLETAMQAMDITSLTYNSDLTASYNQALSAISTIKDKTYAAGLLNDLNLVYAVCAAKKPAGM